MKILGWRNWPGRIPVAASNLYARNLLTFLTTFWDKDAAAPVLPASDDIVARRPADPRRPPSSTQQFPARRKPPRRSRHGPHPDGRPGASPGAAAIDQLPPSSNAATRWATTVARSPGPQAVEPFVYLLAIFLMACFVGYYVVWNVTPALHSPLMGVTNAISSVIIVVGAMLATGLGDSIAGPRCSASSPSPSPA